jgi:hypothetical protein
MLNTTRENSREDMQDYKAALHRREEKKNVARIWKMERS